MAIAKRSMAVEALTPQSAFRDFLKSMDKHRAELLRERDIALHFGDINLAFQCTRDLRQVHEDFLQGPFKADVLKGSDDVTDETFAPESIKKDLLNRMEQEKAFVGNLKQVALRCGNSNLARACSIELALLEKDHVCLKRGMNDMTPKGIRARMGMEP